MEGRFEGVVTSGKTLAGATPVKHSAEVVISDAQPFSVRADANNSLRPANGFRVIVKARLTHGMTFDTETVVLQHINDNIAKAFAEALVKARGDRSQAEFARMLGIANQQTYQRYERGLVPGGLVLYNIATRLGVTVDMLLTGGKVSAEASNLAREKPVLWASELEEHVQFTIVVNSFVTIMTSRQLLVAISSLLRNAKLSDKSKMFWTKIIGEWVVGKSELEEKLPDMAERVSGQPVNKETSINSFSESSIDKVPNSEYQLDVRLTWKQLKARLNKATEPRGKRAELARAVDVYQSRLNSWLDDVQEPGAEATFRLLEWVTAEEAKTKSSTGVQAPVEPKARTEKDTTNETKQSEPPKGSPARRKKAIPRKS